MTLSKKGYRVSGTYIDRGNEKEIDSFIVREIRDDLIEFGLRISVPQIVKVANLKIATLYGNEKHSKEVLLPYSELRIELT